MRNPVWEPYTDWIVVSETDQKKRRTNIAYSVRKKILAMLEEDQFGPGVALPSERELMAKFDVGRPAVREAMQSLQVMGVVEIRHGERAKVAEPSIDRTIEHFSCTMRHLIAASSVNLEHLKTARFAFEKAMASEAARMRTTADIERMTRLVDAQEACKCDHALFLAHDRDFHRAIATISGNPIYAALAEAMFGWLRDAQINVILLPGSEDPTIDEHRAVLAAIEAGDPKQAAKAMDHHLTRANSFYHRAHPTMGDDI